MPTARYQMTFSMGSGDAGVAMVDLLKRLTEKFGLKDETKTLRVALRIADKLTKDHPAVKAALATE